MILFSQLSSLFQGSVLRQHEDREIISLALDSRKVIAKPTTLFFAIRGERHDGHAYLKELYHQGVRQFVVEQAIADSEAFAEANIIQVPDSVDALQKLAAGHRAHFQFPVIGITGSNGKTIIKEWLSQMLSIDRHVVKNPGSYNSQVGVPLSVWQMQPYHTIGIFEAGISRPGEMQKLAAIIQPTIGIFSNIHTAHDEGFVDHDQKIEEKLKLFAAVDTLIYCKDHEDIDRKVLQHKLRVYSWGHSRDADVIVKPFANGYTFSAAGHDYFVTLPFADAASIENCFHCITVMLLLKYSQPQIQEAIHTLRTVPMRLELKEGINHCLIVDDTYNNDLGGLEISLQFLSHQHQRSNKRVILSDILESGLDNDQLISQIVSLLQQHQIHSFVGIGQVIGGQQHRFPAGAAFYNTVDDFLAHFSTEQLRDEVILIKGARSFQFEKIVNRLQRKVHGTVMEINLGALVHNLNYFRSLLKPATKLMVMVKAFAYGSGSNEIANLLQYHKVDYLGVAYTDEGIDLRKNNVSLPIMVMNPSEESFGAILSYNLEPEIYSFKILHAYLRFIGNRRSVIHLKLDTGMHRLGFEQGDLAELISVLKANPHLIIASIFSHLAGADESQHDSFSKAQVENFLSGADAISNAIGYKPLYHVLNSPGILRLSNYQLDMVRLGIGLYGIDPTAEGFDTLRPVATLKTIVSQIKKIRQGETIGYGRRGVAEKDLTLATIAIGYADGFSRAFSRGVGRVLIRGRRAPVIGNVCMDMTMVDISGMEVQEGDDVIIFGETLPIQEVAASVNTISYEILTNTSERVKRIFVAESI
jgi:alanine racemase